MEFAHVVARFGSKVVVIDPNDRPLQAFDPDLVDQLTRWSTERRLRDREERDPTRRAK